jgi:dihydropteroate synthase
MLNNGFRNCFVLNCGGKLLDLSRPRVMGILNTTPDSFYDGGKFQTIAGALAQAERMLSEGADLLDVGGMSSRPGAAILDEEEELQRVLPVVEAIAKHFPEAIVSVDSVRASVARACVQVGASLINDISAGSTDVQLLPTVAELGVPYVLMHAQGNPATMQQNPTYGNVTLEILDFFIQKLKQIRALGIKDVILDVGFGFGKSIGHNYELLAHLAEFKVLDLPILVGLSRKSMIWKALDVSPKDALNGTSALHFAALEKGAHILRAHDVREAREVIKLWEQLEMATKNVGAPTILP